MSPQLLWSFLLLLPSLSLCAKVPKGGATDIRDNNAPTRDVSLTAKETKIRQSGGNFPKDDSNRARRFLDTLLGDPYQSTGGGSMDFGSQGWSTWPQYNDDDDDEEYYYYYYYDDDGEYDSNKKRSNGKTQARRTRFLDTLLGNPYQMGGGLGEEFGSQGWQDLYNSDEDSDEEYYDCDDDDDDCEYYYYYYYDDDTSKRGLKAGDLRKRKAKKFQDAWDDPWPRNVDKKESSSLQKKGTKDANTQTEKERDVLKQRRFMIDANQTPKVSPSKRFNSDNSHPEQEPEVRSVDSGHAPLRRFIITNANPKVRNVDSDPNIRRFIVDADTPQVRRSNEKNPSPAFNRRILTQNSKRNEGGAERNDVQIKRFLVDQNREQWNNAAPAAKERSQDFRSQNSVRGTSDLAAKEESKRFMIGGKVQKKNIQTQTDKRDSQSHKTYTLGALKRFALNSELAERESSQINNRRSESNQREERSDDAFLIPTEM